MGKLLFTGVGALSAILFSASLARADVMVVGSGTFQNVGTLSTSNTPGSGGPQYWNNGSSDSGPSSFGSHAGLNVGWFLAGNTVTPGTSGFTSSQLTTSPNIALGNLQNYLTSGGGAVADIQFASTNNLSQYLLTLTADSDSISYKDSTGTHLLFAGNASAGATVSFTATGNFSLIETVNPGNTTYSSSNDSSGLQAFAVFRNSAAPGTLYVGTEDSPGQGGDRDYNDVVFTLSSVATPEPASLTLVGIGLAGLVVYRRRKVA